MINTIKKDKIGIIPYGSGNIGTLIKTIKNFDKEIILIKDKRDFNKCDKIILPGVGSFGIAIDFLKKKKLIYQLKKYILNGGKTLGICLGMQILYKSSEEAKEVKGLGIINRKIKKIDSNDQIKITVPHIGWNRVLIKEQSREKIDKIVKNKKFYFSHSFADKVTKDINCPSFNYGANIYCSIVKYRNLIASQFHPELSGKAGQEIFNLFLNKNL